MRSACAHGFRTFSDGSMGVISVGTDITVAGVCGGGHFFPRGSLEIGKGEVL